MLFNLAMMFSWICTFNTLLAIFNDTCTECNMFQFALSMGSVSETCDVNSLLIKNKNQSG